jgi:AAA domain
MITAVKEFLRDWMRLLYWVFFKPSALREHVSQISAEQANERTTLREFLSHCRDNRKLRVFLLRTLIFIILTCLVSAELANLLVIMQGRGRFFWLTHLKSSLGFVTLGLLVGAAMGARRGVAAGVAVSIAISIALGGPASAMSSMSRSVVTYAAFGLAFGAAGAVIAGVAGGVASAVMPSIIVSVTLGMSIGLERIKYNTTYGLMFSLGGIIGATRLLFYLFEILPAILAYRRSLHEKAPEQALLHSPVFFDELMVLPQPFLSSLLLRVARKDLKSGLRHLGRVANNPFQRWAAQKTMRTLLERDRIPFFFNLDHLLAAPEPYVQTGSTRNEQERAEDRYFTTKLLLTTLMDKWPKPKRDADWWWPNDYLPRWMTFWLRMRGRSKYTPLAEGYFRLLHTTEQLADQDSDNETDMPASFDDNDLWPLPLAIEALAEARELPHGEEFYQSLHLVEAGLSCESLQQVGKLRDEFAPLFEIDNPLRPQIVKVFRCLRDAAIDAASFLAVAREIARRDALLKAQGVLEESRQLADGVYEPERSLLLAVIEHWRRMFAVEGGRVAERVEVETLPNPYIVGRPVRPEDGRLFAGRREEFLAIEEKLQTGVGLVIYGQRRIGKTSILLHLRERLPHSLLPVYLNLQQLMANTTGGFLRAIGKEIVKQLRDKLTDLPEPPSREEFDREPFLSLNQLLDEIERRLAPGQRVLLSFDEFEELEERVKAGKIEKEIFAYLRGVTQTGRGFTLLFAGLHTLKQMTQEYWNPFFQSVQTVRIDFLGELDARQLIIDPVDRFPLSFDEEAIDRIIALTNSHPYLMQNVCHNLVNRLNDPFRRSNRAKVEDVEAVLEKTLETSGYYFDDYVWNWSSADERVTLALLAEAGEWAGFALVEIHLGRDAALDATRNLVARSILEERSERGELVFRFQIPLSRMWVEKTKPSARILMERGRS